MATLKAEDVYRNARLISYLRAKTGASSVMSFGPRLENLLMTLPNKGPLFPRLGPMHEKHRAKEFRRRCLGLGISGVSLHSYRYAWAERAKAAGYPERYAMEPLGHNRRAIHRTYARGARLQLPSLEEYESAAGRIARPSFGSRDADAPTPTGPIEARSPEPKSEAS